VKGDWICSYALSGGQQQRLTLARALSTVPEILCLNRFSIAVDPLTTMKIEDVLLELKARMTIIVVCGGAAGTPDRRSRGTDERRACRRDRRHRDGVLGHRRVN
jgi:predicted ABC-type transport system involved in lysophospholipase L1 biosynthesis ATPase subunit